MVAPAGLPPPGLVDRRGWVVVVALAGRLPPLPRPALWESDEGRGGWRWSWRRRDEGEWEVSVERRVSGLGCGKQD